MWADKVSWWQLISVPILPPGFLFLCPPLCMTNTVVLHNLQKQSDSQLCLQDCSPSLGAFIQLRSALVQMWSRCVAAYNHPYKQDSELPVKVAGKAYFYLCCTSVRQHPVSDFFFFFLFWKTTGCSFLICLRKVCWGEGTETLELEKIKPLPIHVLHCLI